jgi:O-antigen/teichoic acid export membrane protein
MPSSENKSVAFNAFIVTFQRVASAALGIVTTPIILSILGVEDYGLYVLVVGFVASLAFVNWSLSMTTQRYVAFALGEANVTNQKKAFNNALVIHFVYALLIGLVIVVFAATTVNNFLNVPEGREIAARNLMFIVAGTTFVSIIGVPYLGVLKAVENFTLYALLNILDSIFKLCIALLLLTLPTSIDKLLVYALLLLTSACIVFVISVISCSWKHPISRLSLQFFDMDTLKKMLSFMGWNLLGSLAILGRNQGVSVLLNLFFGVVVNAAYGIAMQINSAMGILTQGITSAITPKILKSAGSDDNEAMISRMVQMTKWGIIFSSFFALVFINEASFLLSLWLGTLPDGAVIFSQLIILFSISTAFSGGLQTVFNAIGKVKTYNIFVSTILLLNLPIAYMLFKWGYASYTIMLVAISLELVAMAVRLLLLKKYINYSISKYLYSVLVTTLIPTLIVFAVINITNNFYDNAYLRFANTAVLTLLLQSAAVYFFMLSGNEKGELISLILKFRKK